MKKRVIALLLALVLLVGLVPGVSAFEDDAGIDPGMGIDPIGMPEGKGTEESPLLIENAEQLLWFAQTISDPNQGAQEVCAVLTADIDLEGEEWTPMGTASYGYKGTFDGKGHKITGLNVPAVGDYVGLFAVIDGGTVKNLIVSGSVSGKDRTGAIVGYLKNGGTLYRCGNEATVTGSGAHTGGLVGEAGPNGRENTIGQCYNAGAVSGSGTYAGGILGNDLGKAAITDCYNTGSVIGSSRYAGGIRGNFGKLNIGKISNCYNAGTVTAPTAGAITSGEYAGENCYAVSGSVIVKDGTAQTLTQPELLEALLQGRTDVWAREDAQNGGYPVLSWQKQKTGEYTGAFVCFARETVRTIDDEETSLPTALLRWSEQDGATGYRIGIWQKVREWKGVTDEELDKLIEEPSNPNPKPGSMAPIDNWSWRLLQLDQNAIIAKFNTDQKTELLTLQTAMDEKFQTMNGYLQQKIDAKTDDEYNAANGAYVKALEAYDAAYQACCEYIVRQAVAMAKADEISLGDYFAKLELKTTVEVRADVTSYDCAAIFAALGDGVYYPSVTSKTNEDGSLAAPSEADVTEDPYTRMNPVTGLSWNGAVAQWEGKENFTAEQAYRLDLYEVTNGGYRFVQSTYIAGDVTQANCRSAFTAKRSYAFTVTAIADVTINETYGLHDSICSEMSPTYTPPEGPISDEWVTITSAEQWIEIANTKDEPSVSGNRNSPSKQEVAWSKNYRLGNDIVFSKLSSEDQMRTKSIGTKTYMFQGEFDGKGHKILGLTLTNSDSGLFAFVGSESKIHNVQIEKPNVNFSGTAAVLALNNYGTIENCAVVNCNINADVSGVMGGMVGRNYGIVRSSYVRGGTFTSSTTTATGHAGFAGANEAGGLIENCWSSMNVRTQSVYAGGFVGLCYGGTIRNCFALGDVSSRGYSGGFVGRSVFQGNVYQNCYAAGTVTCFGAEGHGFIGGNKPDSSFQYDQSEGIINCYYNQASEEANTNYGAQGMSLEDMKTDDFRAALGDGWIRTDGQNDGLPYLSGVEVPTELGEEDFEVTIILAQYNLETYRFERLGDPIELTMKSSGNTRVSDVMDEAVRQKLLTCEYSTSTKLGRFILSINGRALTAPDGWMFTINNVPSNLGISTQTVQYGDTILWYEGMTQNHFRAPERWQDLDNPAGSGTPISSAAELLALANARDEETLAGSYYLTQDIDLSEVENFPGIGSASAPFTGTFDGDNWTISNLTMNGETNVGLFRVIFGGTVKNLKLTNVNVTGEENVGAAVGWARAQLGTDGMAGNIAGLVGNIHVTGSVTGESRTGGVIGFNGADGNEHFSVANPVDNCSFDGTVTGGAATGGIAGQNDGAITFCRTSGAVNASGSMAGGAVGENNGNIYDSHADMAVRAGEFSGGFVGSSTGSVKRCYSLGTVSGSGYVGGFAGSIDAVDTAVSAGTVTLEGTGTGYIGGFAGQLAGTIVGASAFITVKNIYGFCGEKLKAAGMTTSDAGTGLDAALAAMVLRTQDEAAQKLKELFGLGEDQPDNEELKRREAAKKMEEQIAALPDATDLTLEHEEAVDAAMMAFDSLAGEVKALVSEDMKTKLNDCIKRMDELRQLPEDPVARFEKLMEAVPGKKDKVWNTHKDAIDAARACYDEIDQKALEKDQKKLVKTLYSQLTAAEKTYAKNEKAADKVNTLIGKFPFTSADKVELTHEKTITATKKAYDKLSAEQKSFVDPEKANYLLKDVWSRLETLLKNKADIQNLEKRIKKLPAATKIKITDKQTLEELLAAEKELTEERGLKIDSKLGDKLHDSEKAFEDGETARAAFMALLDQLAASSMGQSAEKTYQQAQSMYDKDKKLLQRFTTKEEQNKLKACQKALKKNQSAAAKVNKLTDKLPQADQEAAFTSKEEKAIESAMKAYKRLTTDAERSFLTGEENLLACYRRIHPDEIG